MTPQTEMTEGKKLTPAAVSFVIAIIPEVKIVAPLKGNGTGSPFSCWALMLWPSVSLFWLEVELEDEDEDEEEEEFDEGTEDELVFDEELDGSEQSGVSHLTQESNSGLNPFGQVEIQLL